MKKKNFKIRMIALSAGVLCAGLVQACGAGGGGAASAAPAAAAPINPLTSPINSGLYSVCQGSYAGYLGVAVNSASWQTAADGSGTQVCQVIMTQTWNSGDISRAFLGPDANGYSGWGTSITLTPFDQANFAVSGGYDSSFVPTSCTDEGFNSSNAYGAVYGVSEFGLGTGVITVPQFGGGTLYVGLNDSPGSGGCMDMTVQAQIERCIDVNGYTHPCPTPL